jgi:galactofuranosylgalactofuranosylrhamnosyl-N-acetylglucosaminyl-diphospho-decaprenol beta-1,5/1,6-galactofuranosyltransferase
LCQGAWLAVSDRPVTLPRLYIGICTYNRARFVKMLLRTLEADEFVSGIIEGVLSVSQGEDTQDIIGGMATLAPGFAQKIRIVRQENMGGSGGFGRVMYEMPKTEDSVCVLMDDDIEIEPESLFRAAGFHALLREPACVGGQMLQLENPRMTWETGAKAHLGRLDVSKTHPEIDASRVKGIRRFVRPTESAYNAWWFFLFSTSLIRQHGFPLPLFIKGDDVEFGLRLLQNNIPTITLPGIFVWHDSSAVKNGGPVDYYQLRNFLIIAAIYHDRFSTTRVAMELWWRWSDRTLVHDYGGAHLLLKAVADFLKGPRALQTANPAKLHLEVIAANRRYGTSAVSSARTVIFGGKPRGLKEPQREFKGLRLLRLWHALSARVPPRPTTMPIVNAQNWDWRAVSTHSYYAVDLADPAKVLTFARSRKYVVLAILSFLRSTSQLMVFGRRAQREWKSAFPELTGVQFWERYLRGAGMNDVSKVSECRSSDPRA